MKRIIVWMLALFGCGCVVFADTQKTLEITTRIEPECPTLHQPIFLIVTAHQSIGKLQYQLPTVKDLEIYYEGKSINTLFVNGKQTREEALHFRLRPKKPGTFVIPSFHCTGSKGSFSIPEITFSVDEPLPVARQEGIELSCTHPIPTKWYVGQCHPMNLQLAIKPHIHGQLASYPTHSSEAFSAFKLPDEPKTSSTTINGQTYLTLTWPALITAFQPAKTNLQTSIVVQVDKVVKSRNPFDDPIDAFSMFQSLGVHKLEPLQITSESIPVEVLPLPTPLPQQFSQGIGQFSLLPLKIVESEQIQNEPISLSVSISGNGNFSAIQAPQLHYDSTVWRAYDPKVVFDAKDDYGYQGVMQFTYTIVPLKEGALSLPSVEFCYFNPETKRYQTLKSAEQFVSVKPAIRAPQPTPVVTEQPAVKTKPAPQPKPMVPQCSFDHTNVIGAPQWIHPRTAWFWPIQLMLALGFAVSICLYKRIQKPTHRTHKHYKQNIAQLEQDLQQAFQQQQSVALYAAAHALIECELIHNGGSLEAALEGKLSRLSSDQIQLLRTLEQRYQEGKFGRHNVPMPDSLDSIKNLIHTLR